MTKLLSKEPKKKREMGKGGRSPLFLSKTKKNKRGGALLLGSPFPTTSDPGKPHEREKEREKERERRTRAEVGC